MYFLGLEIGKPVKPMGDELIWIPGEFSPWTPASCVFVSRVKGRRALARGGCHLTTMRAFPVPPLNLPQPDANAEYLFTRNVLTSATNTIDDYLRECRAGFGFAAKASAKMSDWPLVDVFFRPAFTFLFLLTVSLLWGNAFDLVTVLSVAAPVCGFLSFPAGAIYRDPSYNEVVGAVSRLQWSCWVEMRVVLLASLIFKHCVVVFLELGTLAQILFALTPWFAVVRRSIDDPRLRLYLWMAWDYWKHKLAKRFVNILLS
jgi:hypothetical protein